MRPTFFGPSTQPLYGVLDAPATRARKAGVLLLYPGSHEYDRAHWAFRALAAALSARGFAVLRFDYRGVGDSAGDPGSTTFEACVEDAQVAARELLDTTRVQRVTAIGMRLGAAVAMHACETLSFVNHVFLWNPVIDGRTHLGELEFMDRAMRLRLLHPFRRANGELAGLRFPEHVRRSVERIDLCAPGAPCARGVELFAEADSPESAALRDSLARRGHPPIVHTISDSGKLAAFPDAALLAQGAISSLVARMDEIEP
jgi:uncharacterized protein